jgi:hypothetical protein
MSDLLLWLTFTPIVLLFWFSARRSGTGFGEACCAFALVCLPVSLVLKEIGRVSAPAADLCGWVLLALLSAMVISEPFSLAAIRRHRRDRRQLQRQRLARAGQ